MSTIRKYYIYAVCLAVVAVAVCVKLFAAQDRAISSPDRLQMVTFTPMKDLNGTNTAALFKAYFVTIEAKPSGEITTVQTGSYEVDLLKSNGTVVVGGEQFDDREIADILDAVAKREFKKANPDALPQRRRTLRVAP